MKRKAHNNRLDSLDMDLVLQRRKEGFFMREIAEELGVALSTISNALKSHKVKPPEIGEENVCYRNEIIKTKRKSND